MTRVKFGIQMFTAEGALSPPELARSVEVAGFDAVSFPDHTHLPAVTHSLWPHDRGSQPSPYYGEIFDVFVALAAAAMATSTIKLGCAVCILPQRDAIITAKQAASIDRLCGGRLRLGIGAGWNEQEMTNHGVRFGDRHLGMREKAEAMKAIWRDSPAEYHGKTVDFGPVHCGPRPAQPEGPPLLIAGESERAVARAIRYGDGWMARGRDLLPLDLPARLTGYREACRESGRGPLPMIVVDNMHRAEDLETYAKAGVDEVIYVIPPGNAAPVEADLHRVSAMIAAAGLGK